MKKFLAFILTLVLALGLCASLALAEEPDGPYDPKEGYDYYTIITYTIEEMGQDLEMTVSKMEGDKEYNLQFWFFGGPADIFVTIDDNGKYEVTNDSGFFQTDGPAAVEQAEEEGGWQAIGSEAAAESELSWSDADLLYAPNEDYDSYTYVLYTIEEMGQDLDMTVSKMDNDKEFYLDFFFFGGEAQIFVTIDDNGKYEVTNDSGFFQTDGPAVVEQALAQGEWKPIAEFTEITKEIEG